MPEGAFSPRSRAATAAPAALLAFCLLGCGLTAKQKLALTAFSGSAVTLGEATSEEMKAFRADGMEANAQVLLLKGEPDTPGLPKLASLDRGYELARVQPLVRTADALAAYGRTLAALTGNTQAGALKKASSDFLQSLGQLSGAEAPGQVQLDAFGRAVQDLDGWWLEPKRRQALVLLVNQFGPALAKLCDRLVQDFSTAHAKGWVYLQLQLTTERLEAAAFDHFSASTTYPTRKEALDAFRLASDLRAHREEACSRISGAAAALKKAHAKLTGGLQDGSLSLEDLQDLAERTADLRAAMDILLQH
jgi:hypothetical protein